MAVIVLDPSCHELTIDKPSWIQTKPTGGFQRASASGRSKGCSSCGVGTIVSGSSLAMASVEDRSEEARMAGSSAFSAPSLN